MIWTSHYSSHLLIKSNIASVDTLHVHERQASLQTKDQQEQILKRLIDGVYISKEIIITLMLRYKPEGIVENIQANYKAINDSPDIVGQLAQLEISKPHIITMVSIINTALATYKLLSNTQLDYVLLSLFTAVLPVDTDILLLTLKAYSELLKRVAFRRAVAYSDEFSLLIRVIKPTRSDIMHVFDEHLNKCGSQCIELLHDGAEPMRNLKQSRNIRNVQLEIPKELVEAAKPRKTVNTENTGVESTQKSRDKDNGNSSTGILFDARKDLNTTATEDEDDEESEDVFYDAVTDFNNTS
ncbi:hypothetical protein K501DRAFT_272619 [Backusella circina FSU 941]|nr:hypothetical protein K501DRAFT_272619 [Backusella circina FSU 941]